MSFPVMARRALTVVIGCAAGFCALYLLVVATPTGQLLEDAVLRAADNGHVRKSAAGLALAPISVWTVALAVGTVFLIGRRRGGLWLGCAAAGVIVGSLLTAELLQAVLTRPVLLAHGTRREDQGFPSGHTAVAMSVLAAAVLVAPYRARAAVTLLTSAG
ncbi:hypothetical protein, partial [Actinocorallia lasiicapitis]